MAKGSKRCLPLILAIFAGLFCGLTAGAQTPPLSAAKSIPIPDGIMHMKKLSLGAGWVVTLSGHLLWTNDNGMFWSDITPPIRPNEFLESFFILDRMHAWALILRQSRDDTQPEPFRIVRTQNGGKAWNPLHFDKSSFPTSKQPYMRPQSLWFVDAKHGWFQWQMISGGAFSFGSLFGTVDRGITWVPLPSPSRDEFRFYTVNDGWMVTGAGSGGLSVTRDGGKTWRDVQVPRPDICKECRPVYDVPEFQGANNGVLAMTFIGHSTAEGPIVDATYVTRDGGDTWQNTEAFERSDAFREDEMKSSVGDHVIWLFNSRAGDSFQLRSGSNMMNASYPESLPTPGGFGDIDFIDDLNGWLTYVENPANAPRRVDLLATTDGGKTFKVITPPPPPNPAQ